jgi:peroxiredoxin
LKTVDAESKLVHARFSKQFFAKFISEGGLSMPEVGDMAPDFELKSNLEKDKKVRLSNFRGAKNVVLAFYPLAWTPV